jgi:uncharacterized protein YegP (UPF0339 family)
MRKANHIRVKQNKAGAWYFSIKASNGHILCHSAAYSSKQACLYTAKSLSTRPLIVKVVK